MAMEIMSSTPFHTFLWSRLEGENNWSFVPFWRFPCCLPRGLPARESVLRLGKRRLGLDSVSKCCWLLFCTRVSSGQERVNKVICAPVERGRMVTLHNLPEHLAANTWVILKVAMISFFIVNCWPYAVESALLNFAKNAFIILPYTHDIHVLAVQVEMSLFMILNKLNRLSPEPRCLTFKIHSQESNPRCTELPSISRDVTPQNAGLGALGGPALAQMGSQTIPRRCRAGNVWPGRCWNASAALP